MNRRLSHSTVPSATKFAVAAWTVCALLLGLFTSSSAYASTPQTLGGLMTFGGGTTSGTPMCISNVFGVLEQESCPVSGNTFSTSGIATFQTHSDGTFHWIDQSGHDQGCLDILGNNPLNGTVDIATCNGTQAQVWEFVHGQLVPVYHSGYCIDVLYGNQNANAAIDITTCNSTLAQTILPAHMSVTIASDWTNGLQFYCMDVIGNLQRNDQSIDNAICNGTTAQWFAFEPNTHANSKLNAILYSQYSSGTNAFCVAGDDAFGLTSLYDCLHNGYPSDTGYSLTDSLTSDWYWHLPNGFGSNYFLQADTTLSGSPPVYYVRLAAPQNVANQKWFIQPVVQY